MEPLDDDGHGAATPRAGGSERARQLAEIGHELSKLLSVIGMRAELLARTLEGREEAHLLGPIEAAVDQARHRTDALLALARDGAAGSPPATADRRRR
jgi:signal transduction histidine kinase